MTIEKTTPYACEKWHEQNDVDEKYIYENTYVDENNQLRCKECDGLVVCLPLQY